MDGGVGDLVPALGWIIMPVGIPQLELGHALRRRVQGGDRNWRGGFGVGAARVVPCEPLRLGEAASQAHGQTPRPG